jgi:hypothetical protein
VQQDINGNLPPQHPISRERSDIFSMRTSYDFLKTKPKEKSIANIYNKLQFQQHASEHHMNCFKK